MEWWWGMGHDMEHPAKVYPTEWFLVILPSGFYEHPLLLFRHTSLCSPLPWFLHFDHSSSFSLSMTGSIICACTSSNIAQQVDIRGTWISRAHGNQGHMDIRQHGNQGGMDIRGHTFKTNVQIRGAAASAAEREHFCGAKKPRPAHSSKRADISPAPLCIVL